MEYAFIFRLFGRDASGLDYLFPVQLVLLQADAQRSAAP
jgi:hypothetical protein